MSNAEQPNQRMVRIWLRFPERSLDLRDLGTVFTSLNDLYGFSAATGFIAAVIRRPQYWEDNPWLQLPLDEVARDSPRPYVRRVEHESPLVIELTSAGTEFPWNVATIYFFYRLVRLGFTNLEEVVSMPWRAQEAWYRWRIKAEHARRQWRDLTGTAGTPEVEQTGLDEDEPE